MFKVIIAGSRSFANKKIKGELQAKKDYILLRTKMNKILSATNERIQIVSGRANGADKAGEMYAIELDFGLKEFPADWDKFGKAAGHIRNEEMAKYADACVIFWNGKSKGTKNMIENAKKYNLKLRIIYF